MSRKYTPYGQDQGNMFRSEKNNDKNRWPQERHATNDRRHSTGVRVSSLSATMHSSRNATSSQNYKRSSPPITSFNAGTNSMQDRAAVESWHPQREVTGTKPTHFSSAHPRYSEDAMYISKAKEMAKKTEQMLSKLGAIKEKPKQDSIAKNDGPSQTISINNTRRNISSLDDGQSYYENRYGNRPTYSSDEVYSSAASASTYARDSSNENVRFNPNLFMDRYQMPNQSSVRYQPNLPVSTPLDNERPSYDPTIQNILKSIGFNFELTALSQSQSIIGLFQDSVKSSVDVSENTDSLIDPFVGSTFLNQDTEFRARFLDQRKSTDAGHAKTAEVSKKLYDDFSDSDDNFESQVLKYSPEEESRKVGLKAKNLPNRRISAEDDHAVVHRSVERRESSGSTKASEHNSKGFSDEDCKSSKYRTVISTGDSFDRQFGDREKQKKDDWDPSDDESNLRATKTNSDEIRGRDMAYMTKVARMDAKSTSLFRRNSRTSEERHADDWHQKDEQPVRASRDPVRKETLGRPLSEADAERESESNHPTTDASQRRVIMNRLDAGVVSEKERNSESRENAILANLKRDLKLLESRRHELLSKGASRKDAILVHNDMLQEDIKKQIMQMRKRKFHTASPDRAEYKKELINRDKRKKNESSPNERSRDDRKQATENLSKKQIVASQTQEVKKSIERVKLKKMKVTCMYEDEGDHWCTLCNLVSATLVEHLSHLHSSTHTQRLDEHKPPCQPTKKPEKNTLRQALAKPFKGVEFLTTSRAFFCTLCKEFVMDTDLVEGHLKSDGHNEKYQCYTDENPVYEHAYKVNMALRLCNKLKVAKETVDTQAGAALDVHKFCRDDIAIAKVSKEPEPVVPKQELVSTAARSVKKTHPFIGKLPHLRRREGPSAAAATVNTADSSDSTKVSTLLSIDKLVPDAAAEDTTMMSVGELLAIPLPPEQAGPRTLPDLMTKEKDTNVASNRTKPIEKDPSFRSLDRFLTIADSSASGRKALPVIVEMVPTCLNIPVDLRSEYERADKSEKEYDQTEMNIVECNIKIDHGVNSFDLDKIAKSESPVIKQKLEDFMCEVTSIQPKTVLEDNPHILSIDDNKKDEEAKLESNVDMPKSKLREIQFKVENSINENEEHPVTQIDSISEIKADCMEIRHQCQILQHGNAAYEAELSSQNSNSISSNENLKSISELNTENVTDLNLNFANTDSTDNTHVVSQTLSNRLHEILDASDILTTENISLVTTKKSEISIGISANNEKESSIVSQAVEIEINDTSIELISEEPQHCFIARSDLRSENDTAEHVRFDIQQCMLSELVEIDPDVKSVVSEMLSAVLLTELHHATSQSKSTVSSFDDEATSKLDSIERDVNGVVIDMVNSDSLAETTSSTEGSTNDRCHVITTDDSSI